ncbi:MAG: YCF48-related protein [Syntrophothermus sp.]
MKALLRSLALVFLFSPFNFAQWVWQNPHPQGNYLSDIQFVDSLYGWASGTFGTIMKTTDGGENWAVLQTPENDLLMKISFGSRNKGLVSSYNRITYITNDGGLSWDTLKALNGLYVHSMQWLDDNVGFVSSLYDPARLLKTTDGGKTWTDLINGITTTNAGCLFFLDDNYGWAAFGGNKIGATTDGGKTWELTTVPGYLPTVSQIQFIDKSNGFLAGITSGLGDYEMYGIFAFTTDGGHSWTSREIPDKNSNLSQVHFVDANTGYITEDRYPDSRIFYTTNKGADWTVVKGAGRNLAFAGNSKAWAINAQNIINATTDGWKTSVQQTPSATPVILWSVSALDSLNSAACGQYENIIVTHDGGKTWKRTNASDSTVSLNSIYYKNSGEIWAVGSSGNVLHSKDKGETWQKFNLDAPWLSDVTFIDDTTGFIIGSYGNNGYLYRTKDFGQTWQKAVTFTQVIEKIKFTKTGLGWISGYDSVFRSTDWGKTWQKANLSRTYFHTLEAVDNYVWVPIGDSILVSSNGGNTWNAYKAFEYKGMLFSLSAISFADTSNGILGLFDGRIERTTDGGRSWQEDSQFTSNGIFSVSYAGGNHAWAAGSGGMVLYYNPRHTDVQRTELHPAESYSLSQNYPNPFNPSTTISYAIPKQSLVDLKIYDILGREVITLVNKEQPAGAYKVEFNASHLPSGVYIYSIKAGEFSASRKLMLLK